MKTLTKYSLILLATLSVSGCFQEDDKSYVDTYETSHRAVQEVSKKYKFECWMGGSLAPTHYFESESYRHTGSGIYMLDGDIRLPIDNCILTRE